MTHLMLEHLVVSRPSGWGSAQMRRVARLMNGGTPSADEENWGGDLPFVTPPDLRGLAGGYVTTTVRTLTPEGASSGSSIAASGVIVSNRAPIGYVGRLDRPSAFNQGCKVLLPKVQLNERYLAYCMVAAAPTLQELGQGTTFMELSSQSLLSVKLPIPPAQVQLDIADYLDRETAKIDALIDKQSSLVDRLHERRQAVIESVFNADAAHASLGFYVRALPGYAFPSDGFSTAEGGVRLLRGVNIKPHGIAWDETVHWPEAEMAGIARYVLQEGDIVLGLDRPFVAGGTRVARLGKNDAPSLLLQRVVKLSPVGLDADFLVFLLQSRAFREYAEPEFTGVSVPHLSDKQVRDFRVPVPPIEQQRIVAAEVRAETAKIDALIAKAIRFIEVAKERRSALITAAVTGQIDVTKGAA